MTTSNITLKISESQTVTTNEPLEPVWKTVFDRTVATGLLLLLCPLLPIIALIIKFDSRGSVLFRQRRIGRGGAPFEIWKFRSMYPGVAPYQRSPMSRSDPRLTRVGRLMRRASIDELPQLWNVLRGDMSLVGPRPEMPFIVEQYTAEQRRRLAVKPGITGLWQISADRCFPIHENVFHDLHYIQHRSFFLDCTILVKTIFTIVRGI